MQVQTVYKNTANVPLPLALWLAVDEYKYGKYSNEISTTALMKSPRNIIGNRRMLYPSDFPEHLRLPEVTPDTMLIPDILDNYKARLGTAIHSAVENNWNNPVLRETGLKLLGLPENTITKVKVNPKPEELEPDTLPVYLEQRSYKEIDGFVVSGQFDVIVNGHLHDIKSTSTYVWQTGVMDDKYILQGSIYRWLNPELITSDELTINFVFTDWQQFKVKSTENYPSSPCMGKTYKLMSLDETEAYIRNKLKLVHKHWLDPLHLIPCCTEKDIYNSPSKYKYYKKGYTEGARATKVFDTYAAASAYKAEQGNIGDIIEVKGKAFYCDFCNPEETSNTTIVSEHQNIVFE